MNVHIAYTQVSTMSTTSFFRKMSPTDHSGFNFRNYILSNPFDLSPHCSKDL